MKHVKDEKKNSVVFANCCVRLQGHIAVAVIMSHRDPVSEVMILGHSLSQPGKTQPVSKQCCAVTPAGYK
jgi:hypothetical protein